MQLNRIFSSQPLEEDSEIELPGDTSRYVGKVLRLRTGDSVQAFDGSGTEWDCHIAESAGSRARLRVGAIARTEAQPVLPITIWHGLCRGARMDSVIQKSTELGAIAVQPMFTEYCIVKLSSERAESRREHWRRIAISAAEQSGRCRIPAIEMPATFDSLTGAAPTDHTRIIFDPTGTENLRDILRHGLPVIACSGPEGGFSDAELARAKGAGFHTVGLGPRILRTETAPVVALSLIQFLAGDF
jgi:16S rRNA (uracil1498-N3)-methyltransferase